MPFPEPRLHRYWLFAALAIATLTLLFLAYGWFDRRAELREGEDQARQISGQTALIAEGKLQASHQLVHAMELLARQERLLGPQMIVRSLREMRGLNPHINDLLIVDRRGRVAYWTLEGTPPDISDRDYVQHHLRNRDSRLFVSPPMQARARPGNWFFALSDAVRDAQGEVLYVLVVIIETDSLNQLMAVDMAIPGSSQVLMATDGRIYARRPDHESNVGRQVVRREVDAVANPATPAITVRLMSALDQRERIVSFRRLAVFPMIAAGSIDVEQLLAPWRGRMLALAGLWLVLVGAIVAGFAVIVRQDRRMALALAESDRFRKALDHVPAFVYLKDRDSRYLYANQPTLDLFGCTQEQLVGAEDARFFPAATASRLRQIDLKVFAGNSSTEEVEVPGDDGGRRVYLEIKTPLRDLADPGLIVGLCGISTDITGLKDQQAVLEQMVVERTRELMVAKDMAEAANRAKTTFLANVGHELKTPLNGVLGMVGIALRRQTDERTIHQLEVAMSSAEKLLAILNDILDFAKLEADRLTLESTPFDLPSLVEKVHRECLGEVEAKGLALVVELQQEAAGMPLLGDPQRLKQVLGHLVGNAVKFSDRGEIRLRARVAEAGAEHCVLRFEVEDQGIGIGGDDRARLFTAFEQADGSMTRMYGGTGLGLALCKRLVAMMGGEIGFDSTPGRGSTFWFTARFAQPAAPAQLAAG